MKFSISKGLNTLKGIATKATQELADNAQLFKQSIDGLPIFASRIHASLDENQKFDEKHYFVIPFKLSEYGFALHTMRCLPDGIADVNELPKRRIFHFPDKHAKQLLLTYMKRQAKENAHANSAQITSSLESLADQLDAIDRKLTYGMLLVGGLTALINPLLGAGLAAKALLPNVGTLLNKYGLKPVGEKLTQRQVEASINEAENYVAEQFSAANTLQVINPILQELDMALRTSEFEHDPLINPLLSLGTLPELSDERWRSLTHTAICHVYADVYHDPTRHQQAGLGPEDIRWLSVMFQSINFDH